MTDAERIKQLEQEVRDLAHRVRELERRLRDGMVV